MVLVPSTHVEVDHIHDSVSLLKQIKRSFILFPLDKLIGGVVELGHDNGYLIFTDAEFLVVVPVERIIFIVEGALSAELVGLAVDSSSPFDFLARGIAGSGWVLLLLLDSRLSGCGSGGWGIFLNLGLHLFKNLN